MDFVLPSRAGQRGQWTVVPDPLNPYPAIRDFRISPAGQRLPLELLAQVEDSFYQRSVQTLAQAHKYLGEMVSSYIYEEYPIMDVLEGIEFENVCFKTSPNKDMIDLATAFTVAVKILALNVVLPEYDSGVGDPIPIGQLDALAIKLLDACRYDLVSYLFKEVPALIGRLRDSIMEELNSQEIEELANYEYIDDRIGELEEMAGTYDKYDVIYFLARIDPTTFRYRYQQEYESEPTVEELLIRKEYLVKLLTGDYVVPAELINTRFLNMIGLVSDDFRDIVELKQILERDIIRFRLYRELVNAANVYRNYSGNAHGEARDRLEQAISYHELFQSLSPIYDKEYPGKI